MDFPEVWQFKVKRQLVNPETYPSTDAVANKLTSKLPVIKMVNIILKNVRNRNTETI